MTEQDGDPQTLFKNFDRSVQIVAGQLQVGATGIFAGRGRLRDRIDAIATEICAPSADR